jgi:hypothetical protein
MRARWAAGLTVIGLVLLMAACAGPPPTIAPATDAPTAAPSSANGAVVVTFEVAGDERYRILLTEPDDIEAAERLLAGEEAPGIPNGLVVRGVTSVNEGYSW